MSEDARRPWEMLQAEWESLTWEEKHARKTPALGASVSHSNYHLCVIYYALLDGQVVAEAVLAGYPGTPQHTFAYCREKAAKEAIAGGSTTRKASLPTGASHETVSDCQHSP